MDLNLFTTKSQEIISQAQQLTITNGHQAIENSHILSSIISIDKNVFPHITKKIGGNIEIIKKANESIILSYSKVSGGNIHLSNSSQKTVAESINFSKKMKDDYVSIEHLILGMLKSNDDTSQLLKDNGFSINEVNKIILELRKGQRVTSPSQEETYNALNKYALNLNQRAETGKLDPVIGRDDEIRRVLQISLEEQKIILS